MTSKREKRRDEVRQEHELRQERELDELDERLNALENIARSKGDTFLTRIKDRYISLWRKYSDARHRAVLTYHKEEADRQITAARDAADAIEKLVRSEGELHQNTRRTSTRRTSARRSSARRSSARRSSRRMQPNNERLYHVVTVNEKTGGKQYQTATPVTHSQAGTIMRKIALSSSKPPYVHMQLEEAADRSVSPKGIIYPNGTDRSYAREYQHEAMARPSDPVRPNGANRPGVDLDSRAQQYARAASKRALELKTSEAHRAAADAHDAAGNSASAEAHRESAWRIEHRLQRNGTDRYMLVRDLPLSLRAALDNVGYGKKDIEVKARETFNPVAMGGQGRRGFVVAAPMDDSGDFKVSWGSWGGENAFKRTVEGMDEDVVIPPNVAFIQGSEGGGHPTMATVYVSPRAMNPAMLTAGAEVTPKEAKILAIFQQLKSSYRAEEFDRLQEKDGIEGSRARKEATDREIESLVERGFLSRNKVGAVSITTTGRNAAAKNYY